MAFHKLLAPFGEYWLQCKSRTVINSNPWKNVAIGHFIYDASFIAPICRTAISTASSTTCRSTVDSLYKFVQRIYSILTCWDVLEIWTELALHESLNLGFLWVKLEKLNVKKMSQSFFTIIPRPGEISSQTWRKHLIEGICQLSQNSYFGNHKVVQLDSANAERTHSLRRHLCSNMYSQFRNRQSSPALSQSKIS